TSMKTTIQKFVLFGATGDLSQRMVWPSLYHLVREKLVPPTLTFVGSARHGMPDDEFRKFVEGALRKYVLPEYLKEDALTDLLTRITYAPFQAGDGTAAGTEALQKALAGNNKILYFMATSPKFYGPTCLSLAAAGLACEHCRVILEKPIGADLASSVAINEAVGSVFHEDRIFRIDHYLGKEAVQNLLALRFANSLFEPLWNASAIDNVQITVAETVGLEGRTGYYDTAGANTVRGQYTAGNSGGLAVPGYNEEKGAKGGSDTETFVALRAEIDNWRWAGVPFYLRTGKRLPERRTQIVIQFKPLPHSIFGAGATDDIIANRLVIDLQPKEDISLLLMNRRPGLAGARLQAMPL